MLFHGVNIDVEELVNRWGFNRTNISSDEFICSCPLHTDRTPSFSINLETGLYNCFVCGGGDLVDLTMKVEGLDSRDEAVLKLLEWFSKANREEVVKKLKRSLETIRIGNEGAPDTVAPTYPRVLSQLGAPNYLTSRGFTEKICKRFEAKYDKERKAVVLPVYGLNGEVVNYAMRATRRRERPRYQYLAGVPKVDQLFGLNVWNGERQVVIVEGPLDAMWVYQETLLTPLALMGSKMYEGQVEILYQLGIRKVILHLDNDQAGYNGTRRASQLLRTKFIVRVAGYYAPGQDPCDLSKTQLEHVYRNTIPTCELEHEMAKEEV